MSDPAINAARRVVAEVGALPVRGADDLRSVALAAAREAFEPLRPTTGAVY